MLSSTIWVWHALTLSQSNEHKLFPQKLTAQVLSDHLSLLWVLCVSKFHITKARFCYGALASQDRLLSCRRQQLYRNRPRLHVIMETTAAPSLWEPFSGTSAWTPASFVCSALRRAVCWYHLTPHFCFNTLDLASFSLSRTTTTV